MVPWVHPVHTMGRVESTDTHTPGARGDGGDGGDDGCDGCDGGAKHAGQAARAHPNSSYDQCLCCTVAISPFEPICLFYGGVSYSSKYRKILEITTKLIKLRNAVTQGLKPPTQAPWARR